MLRVLLVLSLLLQPLEALAAGPTEREQALQQSGFVDPSAGITDKLRVAVLPFETQADRPELAQYGEGTMDSLIGALQNVPRLILVDRGRIDRVIREQAFGQTGLVDPATAVKMGQLLGTQVVVRGRISQHSPLTITTEFVDVATGRPRSSEQVQGGTIFELQDRVAALFLKDLGVQLTPEQQQRLEKVLKSTASLKAYDYYLKGRKAFLTTTAAGYAEAVKWYERAAAEDQRYALPRAGLAETLIQWGFQQERNGQDAQATYQRAFEAARDAVALNADLAEAHRALGEALNYLHREGYEAQVRRALELNPNDGESWYALWVATRNNSDPDHEYVLKALQLNPDQIAALNDRGSALIGQQRYDQAAAQYRKALQLNPDVAQAHQGLGAALSQLGDLPQAEAQLKEAIRLYPNYFRAYLTLGGTYFYMQRWADAVAAFRQAARIKPQEVQPHLMVGMLSCMTKQFSDAIPELETVLRLDPNNSQASALLSGARANLQKR